MRKNHAQNILEFMTTIFIAIKIALLGMFALSGDLNGTQQQAGKKETNLRIEKAIKGEIDEFNRIHYNGRKPTLEDIDRVLRVYKKHVAEYMRTDDFSPQKMKERVKTLKEDLDYVPDRGKNLEAVKKLEATANELIKILDLQDLPQDNNKEEPVPHQKIPDKTLEMRSSRASGFEQAMDIIREAMQRLFSLQEGNQ